MDYNYPYITKSRNSNKHKYIFMVSNQIRSQIIPFYHRRMWYDMQCIEVKICINNIPVATLHLCYRLVTRAWTVVPTAVNHLLKISFGNSPVHMLADRLYKLQLILFLCICDGIWINIRIWNIIFRLVKTHWVYHAFIWYQDFASIYI